MPKNVTSRITNPPREWYGEPEEHTRKVAEAVNEILRDKIHDPINVKRDYGAKGDGTTDDYAAIAAADTAAAAAGEELYFPPGTYVSKTDFNHQDGTQATARWVGAGPENTILQFNVTDANPRLLTWAPGLLRPERVDTVSPTSNLALLNNQTTVGHLVVLNDSATDASKFAVGDWVFVSCGIDIFDADDDLWRYTMITRIVEIDSGTGNIILADPIEEELSDDGWTPTGAKNTASNWANSTAYTAGDYVYGDTTALWVATSSGTSSGTGPSDDTGVSWDQLTIDLGALKGDRDGRPVIQVVPSAVVGAGVSNMTIENASSTIATQMMDIRSVYNGQVENIWLKGKASTGLDITESSFNTRVNRVFAMQELESSLERTMGTYAARGTIVSQSTLQGSVNSNTTFPVFIEAGATIAFDHCTFSCQQGEAGFCMSVSSGHVSAMGCRFLGCVAPITQNEALTSIIPDNPNLTPLCEILGWQGNFADIDGANFRRLWKQASAAQELQIFSVGNVFRINNGFDGGYTQTDPLLFRPTRLVAYTLNFTPATNQSQTAVTLPSAPQEGILDITDIRAVLLGARVLWVTPTADNVSVDIKMTDGSTTRRAFSTTAASNKIDVDSTTATGQNFRGDGTTSRLIDNTSGVGEKLAIDYDSGASAGGTVYVMLFLLIDDGVGGDVEAA